MIGVEFGAPKSIALKMSWHALEAANKGLFCQMITIPLFKDHKILVQVAGHASHTIKLLPPLTITDEDCTWIENSFEAAIAEAHKVPGVGVVARQDARRACRADERELNRPRGQLMPQAYIRPKRHTWVGSGKWGGAAYPSPAEVNEPLHWRLSSLLSRKPCKS